MTLPLAGILAVWTDIDPAIEADFNAWYASEHLPERLGVPGFRRGRRFRALAGAPRYFACYDLDAAAVLESQAYLERLQHPTPWTERVMRGFRNTTRAAFERTESLGRGSGAVLLSLSLSPHAHRLGALEASLGRELLPGLEKRAGIIRLQYWRGRALAPLPTAEAALRPQPDSSCAAAVIVEASEESALAAPERELVAAIAPDSAAPPLAARYRLLSSLGGEG